MKKYFLNQKIQFGLNAIKGWYSNTPRRALDEAYKAASIIKSIENEYFNGQKIEDKSVDYENSIMTYFQSELRKCLITIRIRLLEFYTTRLLINNYSQISIALAESFPNNSVKTFRHSQLSNTQAIILDKLKLIDEVLIKYKITENILSKTLF